jgi:hypothetical protein
MLNPFTYELAVVIKIKVFFNFHQLVSIINSLVFVFGVFAIARIEDPAEALKCKN